MCYPAVTQSTRRVACVLSVGLLSVPRYSLRLTAGKRREHSVQHVCVTIERVLEDVYGPGWKVIPHVLTAGAVLYFRRDLVVTIALQQADVADAWDTLGVGDCWVSAATNYYSYDNCGTCLFTEDDWKPAMPAAARKLPPIDRRMVA